MKHELSIIIPCYNEDSRGNFTYRIDKLISYMSENTDINVEIILVNDGSDDNTLPTMKYYEMMYDYVKVVTYRNNVGKSYAIKQGIKRANGDYCLIMNADLDIPLKNIPKFYNYIKNATLHHLVIGVRKNKYDESFGRRVLSKLAHIDTRLFLNIKNISDTQCGFKMFRTDKAKQILQYIKSKRWLFDIELILYMQALGIKVRCFEVTAKDDIPTAVITSEIYRSGLKELLMIVSSHRRTIRKIQNN